MIKPANVYNHVRKSYPKQAINSPMNGIDPRIKDHGVEDRFIEWSLASSARLYGVTCNIVTHTPAQMKPTTDRMK